MIGDTRDDVAKRADANRAVSAAKRSKRSQKYTKRKISLFLTNLIVITAI